MADRTGLGGGAPSDGLTRRALCPAPTAGVRSNFVVVHVYVYSLLETLQTNALL